MSTMIGIFYRMLAQSLTSQRLPRRPEPEAVMEGDRAVVFDAAGESENILAVYDYCADLLASSGPLSGRALDLACGAGQFLSVLGERVPSLSLVGLDASRDMLEICRARAAQSAGAHRFSFIEGDMADLCDIPDGAYQLTTWTYAAHHSRDLEQVTHIVREMARVTAADGAILVLDLGRLKTAALNDWYVRWKGSRYEPRLLAEFRDSMNAAWTASELRSVVDAAGVPGLRHYAAAGLPVLQILYRPAAPSLRRAPVVLPPRRERPPEIDRDYRQLSLLFKLSGLEPARTGLAL